MVAREACERRVYRLATLLTGNPLAATEVMSQVLGAQPDLSRLDSAHLDRLTILRSREVPAGRLVSDRLPDDLAASLAGLPFQSREAWILARVYRMPMREQARAMDCSTSAAARHLELADRGMQAAGERAVERVLAYAMSLDLPAFHRLEQARRRRVRRVLLPAVIIVTVIGIVLAILWLREQGYLG